MTDNLFIKVLDIYIIPDSIANIKGKVENSTLSPYISDDFTYNMEQLRLDSIFSRKCKKCS